jgi:hypothetical protein
MSGPTSCGWQKTGEAAAAAVVDSDDATTAVLMMPGAAEVEAEDGCDVCCCWLEADG